jgi:HEAT repeat protein
MVRIPLLFVLILPLAAVGCAPRSPEPVIGKAVPRKEMMSKAEQEEKQAERDTAIVQAQLRAAKESGAPGFLFEFSQIGRRNPERVIPTYIEILRSGRVEFRPLAAAELGRLGAAAKPAIPALRQCLKENDEAVAFESAVALGRIGPDAAEAIVDLAEALQGASGRTRAGAAYVLGSMGLAARPALAGLTKALQDPQPLVRALAACALGEIGPDASGATESLSALLAGTQPDFVRAAAAASLGKFGPAARSAIPVLCSGLKEVQSIELVRGDESPAPLGGDIYRTRHLPADIRLLRERLWPSRQPLARFPDPVLARQTRQPLARYAAIALAQIGPAAIPDLIAIVKDLGHKGREYAVVALGELGPNVRIAAVSWLRPLLKGPDVNIQRATAEALRKIDPEEASRLGIR